jgi:hypothetical protein
MRRVSEWFVPEFHQGFWSKKFLRLGKYTLFFMMDVESQLMIQVFHLNEKLSGNMNGFMRPLKLNPQLDVFIPKTKDART